MQFWFDADFDGSPWPGPLAGRDAAFGEAWVGPHAFLNVLETQLGVAGPVESESARIAALVPQIQAVAGFWSESAKVDPMGVARTLVRWRDTLWSGGWRGEGVAPRLIQLATVTKDILPGMPDRLVSIADRAQSRRTDISAVHLLEPRVNLSKLWQKVLLSLEVAGAVIHELQLEETTASGDLLNFRSKGFIPKSDGSLQLLRPQGPQSAAEEVAAWLANLPDLQGTVIITPDALLDAALHRHGLPTVGAFNTIADNALLEILPLVLSLGWSPPDPERALELLTLPVSPVPRSIANSLVKSLQEWPAVDSDSWRKALIEGLEKIDDPKDRQRVKDRLDVFLKPQVKDKYYPATEIKHRTDILQQWLRGRIAKEMENTEMWEAALAQCLNFQRLVQLTHLTAFSRPQLQRLVEDATGDSPGIAPRPAQAGLFCVSAPGAIAGPARRVVWWNFTRASAPGVEGLPLLSAERRALKNVGVVLPEPAEIAVGINIRWRRPLLCTKESLLLVCPRNGSDGEGQHPHPLWDEITATAGSNTKTSILVVDKPMFANLPKMQTGLLLPILMPQHEWSLPSGFKVPKREVESPTAAGDLVGCPFHWLVKYVGQLWPGQTASLPAEEKLLGNLAHAIVARLLKEGLIAPDLAKQKAEALFDDEGPRLAAPLFMPGSEAVKARSRQATGQAVRVLFTHLQEAKVKVISVEQPFSVQALDTTLDGRPDLVVGPPTLIIDLKWGRAKDRQTELENGAAYQLAAYSRLLQQKGPMPPVAFFILQSQRMLTVHKGLFSNTKVIQGASVEETWTAFERSYAERMKELADGKVISPGRRDEKEKLTPAESYLQDGKLSLTPPCKFCQFGWLCGYALEAQ